MGKLTRDDLVVKAQGEGVAAVAKNDAVHFWRGDVGASGAGGQVEGEFDSVTAVADCAATVT
jgi:hypothetical protein